MSGGRGLFLSLSPLSSSCPPHPAGFVIEIVTCSLMFKFVDFLEFPFLSSVHSCIFSSWQFTQGVSVRGGNISGGGVCVVDSLLWLGVLMGVK